MFRDFLKTLKAFRVAIISRWLDSFPSVDRVRRAAKDGNSFRRYDRVSENGQYISQ